ncbi:MAG: nucleotidyl transferase AbiEii/AbiGii toxin family protein [Halobacteriota archaeon]
MADPEILRYLAAKTGLGLKYLSKDEKISILMEQISELIPEATLKGGTALNRIHLSTLGVSRFSEDIDLDLISDLNLDQKISFIKQRMEKISGFDVQGPRILHRTIRFDCYFINEFDDKDRVRVEFYLTRTPHLKSENFLVKSPFIESHPVIFKVYSLEDLMVRKIMALHNRTEGKDIYDVFYCLDLSYDKQSFIEGLDSMLDFYKCRMKRSEFLENLNLKLKDAERNAYYIGNSTNHFIPRSLRPNWSIFIRSLSTKIGNALE